MNLVDGATLIGPPVAVILGYFGWILRPRREIHVKVLEPTLINPPQSYQDLALLVRHQEEEIEQPVVSYLVFVRNTGNRDISRDDFIEPLKICAPPNHVILSTRFGGPEGAKLDTKAELEGIHDGPKAIYVRWNLLKPRQHFVFRIMMAKTNNKFSIDSDENITHTALIKDVKERTGWHSFISRLLLNYLLIAIAVGVAVALVPQPKFWEPIFTNSDGQKVVITKKNETSTKVCEVLGDQRIPDTCRKISDEELKATVYSGFEPIRWKPRFLLNPLRYWWLVLLPFVGVAFDFRKDISRMLRRLTQLARSGSADV